MATNKSRTFPRESNPVTVTLTTQNASESISAYKNSSNRLPPGLLVFIVVGKRDCNSLYPVCQRETNIHTDSANTGDRRGQKHLHNKKIKAELKTTELPACTWPNKSTMKQKSSLSHTDREGERDCHLTLVDAGTTTVVRLRR